MENFRLPRLACACVGIGLRKGGEIVPQRVSADEFPLPVSAVTLGGLRFIGNFGIHIEIVEKFVRIDRIDEVGKLLVECVHGIGIGDRHFVDARVGESGGVLNGGLCDGILCLVARIVSLFVACLSARTARFTAAANKHAERERDTK